MKHFLMLNNDFRWMQNKKSNKQIWDITKDDIVEVFAFISIKDEQIPDAVERNETEHHQKNSKASLFRQNTQIY